MCISKHDRGLGLHDMESFNVAMFEEQWWRISNNERSLVFCVLKHHFFPLCDAREATNSANISYIWHSLMVGKKIADMGSYYRVGNSSMIKVATDPLLPSLPNFMLQRPVDSRLYGLKVGDLISHATDEWKVDKLNDLFDNQVVDAILKIPISKYGGNNGKMTVKCAYFQVRILLGKSCST